MCAVRITIPKHWKSLWVYANACNSIVTMACTLWRTPCPEVSCNPAFLLPLSCFPRSSFPPAASRKEQQSWHVLLPSSHLAMTNTAHQNAQLGMQEYWEAERELQRKLGRYKGKGLETEVLAGSLHLLISLPSIVSKTCTNALHAQLQCAV